MKKLVLCPSYLKMGICLIFLPSLGFATNITAFNSGEPNLSKVKQQLVKYHDSGKYKQQIVKANQAAIAYLQQRINSNLKLTHPKKLAIVLDIDETSLSNYQNMKKFGFGGSSKSFDRLNFLANDQAIKPTLKLYQFAQAHHVETFFITGRREYLRAATAKNLRNVGYTHWAHLYLKPMNYHGRSATPYKSQLRKQIEKQGYDIVLSVGDQYSDLKGGYADHGFKLPDPYYYIG